jgi:pimeloyl-ACP methyl ester carboxylesterase
VPETLFDHPVLTSRYFFPVNTPPLQPMAVPSGGARLLCRAVTSPSATHTLLHFHGNGETVSDYESRAGFDLTEPGVNALFTTYRGYGGSTGEPGLTRGFDDIDALMSATGVSPQNVVVFGRSLGSLYAIEAASRYPVAGLVIESGIAWPVERVLLRASPTELGVTLQQLQSEADRWLNHERKLQSVTCPVLILHALHDDLVSVDHARALHDWLPAGQGRLVILPQGDHNTLQLRNRAAYREALTTFYRHCGCLESL